MKTIVSVVWMAGVVITIGCSHTPASQNASRCTADVQSFSNPEAGARGDFSPNVRFADLRLTPESIGYGAAGGRSDEITIADGVLHLARPSGDGFAERTASDANEGAYMVQLISPKAWGRASDLSTVANIDELGARIAAAATARGCRGATKLAYRVTTTVLHAEWSLDTLPARGDFATDNEAAIIVGLYANVDQQAHFVTPGRNIHAHIVFPRLGVAGHLKAVSLAPGGKLRLQEK